MRHRFARKLAILYSKFDGRVFGGDEIGSVAIEFVLIFPMAIALVLFGFALAFCQTAKSQLDDAARVVGRQIMVGTVSDGTSVGKAICANIPAFIDCTQVMFDLQPYGIAAIPTIPPGLSYDGSGNVTNVWAVNFGNPGSIMVLRLYYQFPIVGGPFVPLATQQNGTKLLVSTYIFVREG